MIIVGINGFKTSGKNTAYEFLREYRTNLNIEGVGFADKLKIVGLQTLGFDRPDAELLALADEMKIDWNIKIDRTVSSHVREYELGRVAGGVKLYITLPDERQDFHYESGREFLQNFGQKARERFGDSFWVDQVLPVKVTERQHPEKNYITYDCYELDTDRYEGVDVLCITDLRYPNEADRIKALGGVVWEVARPGLESDGHSSEQPLPRELVDWTIFNDGTLDDLRRNVELAARETL